MTASRAAPPRCYSCVITARSVAALAGGYGVAAVYSSAGALTLARLGVATADSVVAANMMAFIAYAAAVLWAFGCGTTLRAWAGIAGLGLLPAFVLWGLQRGGA